MSYPRRCTGEIRISPPLKWEEFRRTKIWTRNVHRDGQLHVTVRTENLPEGELRRISATSMAPNPAHAGGEFSMKNLEPELQEIVDMWPEREYTGFILCEWEEGEPSSRLYVKDGKVVEVKPVVTWPDV